MRGIAEQRSYNRYHNVLPEDLTSDDIELARMLLETEKPDDFKIWARQRSNRPFSYKDRRFRMIVDKPFIEGRDHRDPPTSAVIVFSEIGTNALARFIAKSRVIRDMVDPTATLIMQSSSVVGEDNMNFSYDERYKLFLGDMQPIIGRVAAVLGALGEDEKCDMPNDLTMIGLSMGTVPAQACGASDQMPAAAVALAESPNVIDRGILRLGNAFFAAGGDLSKVVRANFEKHLEPFPVLAEHDASTVSGMIKFMVPAFLHPDAYAMTGAMCQATAEKYIRAILESKGSVVQAWGDVDNVSPADANRLIAKEFDDNPRYCGLELPGMTHAITDFYALDGALARKAHNIKLAIDLAA